MSQMIDRLPVAEDLVTIVERASLYQILQAALRRQHRPTPPARLHADLGLPPSQRPDFTPRCR